MFSCFEGQRFAPLRPDSGPATGTSAGACEACVRRRQLSGLSPTGARGRAAGTHSLVRRCRSAVGSPGSRFWCRSSVVFLLSCPKAGCYEKMFTFLGDRLSRSPLARHGSRRRDTALRRHTGLPLHGHSLAPRTVVSLLLGPKSRAQWRRLHTGQERCLLHRSVGGWAGPSSRILVTTVAVLGFPEIWCIKPWAVLSTQVDSFSSQ